MKNIEIVKLVPHAPESLGKVGAEHWKRILKIMVPAERITKLDLPVIEIMCQVWERIQSLWESNDPDDYTKYKTLSDLYLKFIDRYGATPRARKILGTPAEVRPKQPKVSDKDILDGFDV